MRGSCPSTAMFPLPPPPLCPLLVPTCRPHARHQPSVLLGPAAPTRQQLASCRAQTRGFRQSKTEHGSEHSICVTQPEIKTLLCETPGRESHPPHTWSLKASMWGPPVGAPRTRWQLDCPVMAWWGGTGPIPRVFRQGTSLLRRMQRPDGSVPIPPHAGGLWVELLTGPGSLATKPMTPP